MRTAVEAVRPDAVVHLGDYYDDAETLRQEFPHIPMYQVPGNCDRFRVYGKSEIRIERIFGVNLYMTHGHNHQVKFGLGGLLRAARTAKVQAVLYGHTHAADCHQEEDGLWVLNPGSCGSYSGSVGLMEVDRGEILSCRILRQDELL